MDTMIDIETMSPDSSHAVVISVAMLRFSMNGAEYPTFGARSTINFDVREQLVYGRLVDPGTQLWWERIVDPAARDAAWCGNPFTLEQGLKFIQTYHEVPEDLVWANGVVFDIGNLESLFRMKKLTVPWRYNSPRDARTAYRLKKQRTRPLFAKEQGPAHDPMVDCVNQVWKLWEHWPDGGIR